MTASMCKLCQNCDKPKPGQLNSFSPDANPCYRAPYYPDSIMLEGKEMYLTCSHFSYIMRAKITMKTKGKL